MVVQFLPLDRPEVIRRFLFERVCRAQWSRNARRCYQMINDLFPALLENTGELPAMAGM
jgi:hypothetical protein